MSKHSKIGIKGEGIASDFLQKKGYTIINTNWRASHKEVDIIAFKADMLVMVEVKTRKSSAIGFPEESVTLKKQKLLKAAAEAFAAQFPEYRNIRFDIISIIMNGDTVHEIVHFEEAFY